MLFSCSKLNNGSAVVQRFSFFVFVFFFLFFFSMFFSLGFAEMILFSLLALITCFNNLETMLHVFFAHIIISVCMCLCSFFFACSWLHVLPALNDLWYLFYDFVEFFREMGN